MNKLQKLSRYSYFIVALVTVILCVFLDQSSKTEAFKILETLSSDAYVVLPVLKLVAFMNKGVSFSLFAEYASSNQIFLFLNSAIVILLLALLYSARNMLQTVSYGLIIGGAIGNLLDRYYYGAVRDFIFFHYNEYSFPAFNLADSFIFVGVFLIIYDQFFGEAYD